MTELVRLEEEWRQFEDRKVRVLVVSVEDREAAEATQKQFPHMVVVSDAERHMAEAVDAIHVGAGPGGADALAPTTMLVDGGGTVRWVYRPDRVTTRLSPAELLAAIDREMPAD
jgi:peroxiredoxin